MKKILTKLMLLIMCLALIGGGFAMVNNVTTKAVHADEPAQTNEKIADVYLIAGQSNAVGSTLIANGAGPCYEYQNNKSFADSSIRYENVLYNHHAHPTTKGSGYMITNFVPVTQGLGYTSTKSHIGPELGMAEYLDPIYAQKENTDAIIVKVAAGGTTLIRHYDDANLDIEELRQTNSYDGNYGTWYPESLWNVTNGGLTVDLWDSMYYRHPTGLLYRELITFIKNNYAWLQEKGYTKINFKALCWMQGESDRGSETAYKTVFNAFMNDVRRHLTELTGEDYSKFPVVSGEISKTFSSAVSQPTNEKFIAMQHEIGHNLNHAYVIPTKDFLIHDYDEFGVDITLGSDGAHWNYPDMLDIGYLFGEKAYNVSMDDKWIYFDSTAKRNDHLDKTNLENVKFDLDEFNKNSKLSFSCSLKSLYDITSFKIKDGIDLMPYLTQTVEDGMRKYKIEGVSVDNSEDITIESYFTNATAYNVSVSIAEDGSGYGDKIYTYAQKVYKGIGQYSLEAHPAQDGRVYSVTINGIEVEGAKNKSTIVIDNIFDYLNGQTSFEIIVQYSPIPPKRIEASGYIGTYEVGEAFSKEGLVIKFLDELDNETVLKESEYTVDSSLYNPDKVGTYLITIASGEYTCSYTVKVVAPVLEIENPKTTFILGEEFSIGEGKVYLVSKAGRRELSDSEYTVNTLLFSPNYASTYDISVSGQGASGTYKVKVVVPDSIVVENAKTEFSGEEFSTGDIVVKAIVNGEEIVLDESAYNVSSKDFVQNKSGTYTIKVSAAGKNVTYDVTVTVASAGGGCGANAMDIIGLAAGLCALAFAFKRK